MMTERARLRPARRSSIRRRLLDCSVLIHICAHNDTAHGRAEQRPSSLKQLRGIIAGRQSGRCEGTRIRVRTKPQVGGFITRVMRQMMRQMMRQIMRPDRGSQVGSRDWPLVLSKTESTQATGFITFPKGVHCGRTGSATAALPQTNWTRSHAPDSLPSSLHANKPTEGGQCFSTPRADHEGRRTSWRAEQDRRTGVLFAATLPVAPFRVLSPRCARGRCAGGPEATSDRIRQ
jgi:hypothetical protein